MNLDGEIWTQHGDNHFNRRFSDWRLQDKLSDITYDKYSPAAERIIEANLLIGLGSLIGIKYYNMPVWLRLPMQYLLPLKFRWTADIAKEKKAVHLLFVELDVLF